MTGDTLVATADGWQRIDSLVGRSARIIGADGQPHLVTRIFPTGRKPIVRLRTRAGYEVQITEDHKVLTVDRGDVAVRDLRPSDRIYLQGGGFGRRALEPGLALGIGVAVGDGCLTRSDHRWTRAAHRHPRHARRRGGGAGRRRQRGESSRRSALKAVGSVGRNRRGLRDPRRYGGSARLWLPARGGRVPSARRPRRGLRGQAVHRQPCSSWTGPPSPRCSAGSSPRTGRSRTTARSRSTWRSTRPRRIPASGPALAARLRHQVRSSTGTAAARPRRRFSPTAKAGRREYPVGAHVLAADQPLLALRLRAGDRLPSRESEGRPPSLELNARDRHLPRRAHRRGGFGRDRSARPTSMTSPRTPPITSWRAASSSTTAPSTCSSTTPPATWPRSTWSSSCGPTAPSTWRLSARLRLWTLVLEISVLMAAYPSRADRRAELALPHARPRLRQHGHGADARRASPTTRPRRWPSAARSRRSCTARLRHLGGDRQRSWARSPAMRRNREAMLRVMRNHRRAAYNAAPVGVRGPHHQAPGHRSLALPEPDLVQAARETWDRALTLGETLRIPERPGHRARAHRHHRPGDGLRHHRDRAGLRPGEVQEAGGRRLLQDHQPEHPAGAARAGLPRRRRSTTSWPTAWDARRCAGRRTSIPQSLRAKGFDEEGLARVEDELEGAFDLTFAFNAWTLGEGYVQQRLGINEARLAELECQSAARARVHRGGDRGRQRLRLRHHDGRRRPASQDRAPPRLRLRQPLRQEGAALHRGGRPYPHDGGGPALPVRRHQQDHQHARGRHHRGRQAGLSRLVAEHAQGGGAVPRRLQALPAAQLHHRRGGRRGRRRGGGGGEDDGEGDHQVHPRAAPAARPARRLYPEGGGRRPQGLPPHRGTTRTARWARSSSTCTRKAPPSAAS